MITCIFMQSNNGFSSICWSKRPGVHITILHWSMRFFSNFKSFPPITRPADISWYWPTFRNVSYIWYANSLVGVIINAPRLSNLVHCLQYKISKTWNKQLSIKYHNCKLISNMRDLWIILEQEKPVSCHYQSLQLPKYRCLAKPNQCFVSGCLSSQHNCFPLNLLECSLIKEDRWTLLSS